MTKLNLGKLYKSYYTASHTPEMIEIERAQFLCISGQGDPSEPSYLDVLQALYSVAYTVKFMYKAIGKDFTVPKLEGIWSYDEAKYGRPSRAETSKVIPRSEWLYEMLLRMPEYVTEQDVNIAIEQVTKKKKIALAPKVAFITRTEGKVVQMLHVGPFDRESETLAMMLEYIQRHELKRNGNHHEIYLTDYRKTSPDKLRTILREPVI